MHFLTIFQFANFILWIFIAEYKFIEIYELIPLMFFVGLMGGASYVNVMYQFLESNTITQKEKELSVNICTIIDDIGIFTASACSVIISNFMN